MILGVTHFSLGNFQQGREHLEQNVELTQSHLRREAPLSFDAMVVCANSRAWLALNLIELGEFDRAVSMAREAVEVADAVQHAHMLARWVVAWSSLMRGAGIRVIPELEQGLALCESVHHLIIAVPYAAALGRAYTLAGRSAEAVALLEATVLRAETHNRAQRASWLSFLSEAYLIAGRPGDAVRAARSGLEWARARQERGDEAWSLHALAQARCADLSGLTEAEAHYREALALAEKLGMRPLAAHCHAGLAKLYRRAGNPQHARDTFNTARAMFREMDMRLWLEQAEAELKELE